MLEVPELQALGLLQRDAIGTNLDSTLPPNNAERERITTIMPLLSPTTSVSLDSPLMETSQALLLVAHYSGTANRNPSRDSSWALIGLASKLAQSVRH